MAWTCTRCATINTNLTRCDGCCGWRDPVGNLEATTPATLSELVCQIREMAANELLPTDKAEAQDLAARALAKAYGLDATVLDAAIDEALLLVTTPATEVPATPRDARQVSLDVIGNPEPNQADCMAALQTLDHQLRVMTAKARKLAFDLCEARAEG